MSVSTVFGRKCKSCPRAAFSDSSPASVLGLESSRPDPGTGTRAGPPPRVCVPARPLYPAPPSDASSRSQQDTRASPPPLSNTSVLNYCLPLFFPKLSFLMEIIISDHGIVLKRVFCCSWYPYCLIIIPIRDWVDTVK
ncbi:unnamed protein product [Rangifer tarandus platyrhynchus]|uniref:Uncharacterized protein n=2 Tax=Rangifer tarandus platyrhynchus TaxID=3082113 RepID=A0AC59ZPL3_RANTA|nr:unnamed protein product [Rangifer tarandus platyrhynchus]